MRSRAIPSSLHFRFCVQMLLYRAVCLISIISSGTSVARALVFILIVTRIPWIGTSYWHVCAHLEGNFQNIFRNKLCSANKLYRKARHSFWSIFCVSTYYAFLNNWMKVTVTSCHIINRQLLNSVSLNFTLKVPFLFSWLFWKRCLEDNTKFSTHEPHIPSQQKENTSESFRQLFTS
jgi:hypothetical protein